VAKTIFAGTVFFRGKNRFLPVTGKNLPTLIVRLCFAFSSFMSKIACQNYGNG